MSTAKANASADKSAADSSEQYLTFMLAGEEYGVDILRVQEIKGWDKVTRIPHTPDYVLGVINLRGAVVPILDLRRRFGLETIAFGPTTVVIVVRVMSG
ncbi:MAG TPA: chemotaxis protein CheW, partial [Steroidobacteraceae bacterium]